MVLRYARGQTNRQTDGHANHNTSHPYRPILTNPGQHVSKSRAQGGRGVWTPPRTRVIHESDDRVLGSWHPRPLIVVSYLSHVEQEAQLSPRDPRDALYQLKYWSIVVRITQTDRVSARKALSATATFYSATCLVLYTQYTPLSHSEHAMPCMSSTDFRTTHPADVN